MGRPGWPAGNTRAARRQRLPARSHDVDVFNPNLGADVAGAASARAAQCEATRASLNARE